MSNTKHLADLLKVCSILPALAIMPAMAEEYTVVPEEKIAEARTFSGNYSWLDASTDSAEQSIWWIKGGDVVIDSNSVFANNKADVGVFSVSIKEPSSLVVKSGTVFENNTVRFDGGAIAAYNKLSVSGATFRGNTAQTDFEKDTTPMGGGALALGSESQTMIVDSNFVKNESKYHGGAIAMRGPNDGDNSAADLDIIGSEFNGNIAAQKGGAIYSTFYDSENAKDSVYVEDSDFIANTAANGGAIYNEGKADLKDNLASMKIVDSDFVGNTATTAGGAVFNASGMTILGSEFVKNSVTAGDGGAMRIDVQNGSKTVIKDSEFSENKALGYSQADSGAISIRNGDVEISGTDFDKNEAMFGGAMYLYSGNNHHVVVDITDSEFTNNSALGGGAIVNIASNKNNEKGGLRLTGTKFESNAATAESGDGGGALFLGAQSQTYITRGMFNGNTSAAAGGAISMRDGDNGNNKDAKLDIVDSVFANNIAATQGGAIYSTFYNSVQETDNVYLSGSSFVNNKAQTGGAIYNEGNADLGDNFASMKLENVDFVGNTATDKGGAIFNGAGGTINMSGDNVFSGNVAKGLSNDIHNMGTLNIVDGTTTFGGGVSGNGTFTLAQGATLDIGTSTIHQNTIELNGNVIASLLNDSARGSSYGRFNGDNITIGESAQFTLNVGAVGTYNIWGNATVNEDQITIGDIYEIAEMDANGVKIVTKSVADIADAVGISTQAAGAVAGLANANSGKAHQVSLALQEALNGGDAAYVERETKKLNPTDKPVAQAAAASVQNQVLSLASGRMAGGVSVGRAGGDEATQENGFWIQGLFNKSKFGDQFHGYTRGVALGADTLIDNKWTIGGGLAFNNSDVHADAGRTDIDTKTLFLYGQYKPNNWFVNATATYSMSEYTENKTVAGVSGLVDTYDVDAYGVQMMGGYDFAPGITTEAGLRYLHIAQDEYVDARDAQIMATDTDFLTGVAGLKYAFAIENDWAIQLRPELRAAMTYDFISDDTATTVVMPGTEAYAVNGEQLSRLGGEFGIGLTAQYKGMEVSLMYDLDLHQDYTSQTGMIKFRGRF